MKYIISLFLLFAFLGCNEQEQTIVVHLPNAKEVFTIPPLTGQKTAVVYLTLRESVSGSELYCTKIETGVVLPSEYKNPIYMTSKELTTSDSVIDISFKNVFKDDYFLIVEIYNTENILKDISCTPVEVKDSSNYNLE